MAGLAWRVVESGLELRVRATARGGRDAVAGVRALSDLFRERLARLGGTS